MYFVHVGLVFNGEDQDDSNNADMEANLISFFSLYSLLFLPRYIFPTIKDRGGRGGGDRGGRGGFGGRGGGRGMFSPLNLFPVK
jgi:hypothetical protein